MQRFPFERSVIQPTPQWQPRRTQGFRDRIEFCNPSRARKLPILQPLCAWKVPSHAGAVLVGLGQQRDAMALKRGDKLRPHIAAHMPVAQFLMVKASGGE